jgi:phosphoenolpyruvate---glycerone phosphotransferase subunit DhaL
MDQNRQVDVGTLLGGIATMLEQNQGRLNEVDTGARGGTHGERMAQAFEAAARAASQAGTNDAGEQLAIAAQAMRQQGKGKAAGFYANGLEEAASQFQGQSGISLDNLGPLLQALAGGVQRGNPAQQGQGTMIDALLPAVSAFMSGQQQGLDPKQAAIQALLSAITGAQGTATRRSSGAQGGYVDPGAASATNVLGGIFGSLLPGVIGALGQGAGAGGLGGIQQPSYPGGTQQSGYPIGQSGGDPLGGLGGGLGGLLGGLAGGLSGGQGAQGGQSSGGWWPFETPTSDNQGRFV